MDNSTLGRDTQPVGCDSIAGVNVLALYDIHGNIDALEAVLADPRAQSPDLVLVGGDAVPGPFAQATLDRLAPLDARWIRGNGEREVAEAVDGPDPDPDDLAGVTAKITAAELGARDLEGARRVTADTGARRRPVLPRDAARG